MLYYTNILEYYIHVCTFGPRLLFLQALGLHGHEEEGAGHGDEEHEEDKEFVWKALVLIASIYVFFLFETLMHLILKGKVGESNGNMHTDAEVSNCFVAAVVVMNECYV